MSRELARVPFIGRVLIVVAFAAFHSTCDVADKGDDVNMLQVTGRTGYTGRAAEIAEAALAEAEELGEIPHNVAQQPCQHFGTLDEAANGAESFEAFPGPPTFIQTEMMTTQKEVMAANRSKPKRLHAHREAEVAQTEETASGQLHPKTQQLFRVIKVVTMFLYNVKYQSLIMNFKQREILRDTIKSLMAYMLGIYPRHIAITLLPSVGPVTTSMKADIIAYPGVPVLLPTVDLGEELSRALNANEDLKVLFSGEVTVTGDGCGLPKEVLDIANQFRTK